MKNKRWCLTMLVVEIALIVCGAATSANLVEESEFVAFWTTEAGDTIFNCEVQFSDYGKRWHKLVILKQDSDSATLVYEPDFSRIQQFSNIDLTGDGADEILTSWSDGMGSEAVVIQLVPVPRIVFHQPYKYGFSVEPQFQYPYLDRIQIFTGASNPDDVSVTSYEWSPVTKLFVERESRTIHAHLFETSSGSPSTGPANDGSGWPEASIRLGSRILLSRLLHRADPVEPREASLAGLEEEVVVELLVDDTGKVASARVIKGDPRLSQAVLEAVRQWRFEPLIVGKHAVKMRSFVTLRFPEDFRR